MKKIILSFIAFVSFFSLSLGLEANIKFGYDFLRYSNHRTDGLYEYEKGFVLGIELLPLTFKEERIKLGLGLEYNFGIRYFEKDSEGLKPDTLIPLYVTSKFTYYRPKNIDLNLYTFARLGYAISEKMKNNEYTNYNGLYYGLGLGLDYKYLLAEILYDGKYTIDGYSVTTVYNSDDGKSVNIRHLFNHKVGIRLGLQLGTQHFKKPQIISENKK